MPNWCSTAYAIEGDAKEIKSLYELMKRLEDMEKPSVENGFGTTWLGCLVDALGKDWNNVHCRGSWSCLELEDDVLKFSHRKRHGLRVMRHLTLYWRNIHHFRYYFQAEEPGIGIYETNDEDGTYFSDRYFLDACTPDEEYISEYFEELEDAFQWLEKKSGSPSGLWRMSKLLPLNGKNKMRTLFAICTSLMW